MRKLRAIINKTVGQKTKKMMKRLSDDLQTSRAEATLERLGRQKAIEALRYEKKKRKRGRKLIEQLRAEEGSGAILFIPKKVRAALELRAEGAREGTRESEQRDQSSRNSLGEDSEAASGPEKARGETYASKHSKCSRGFEEGSEDCG
jgi:hypothetical protein